MHLPLAASRDKITGSVNMTELLHSNENYDMKITTCYNLTMQTERIEVHAVYGTVTKT